MNQFAVALIVLNTQDGTLAKINHRALVIATRSETDLAAQFDYPFRGRKAQPPV